MNYIPTDLIFNFINDRPRTKKAFHKYKDVLVKAHTSKLRLEFMKTCLNNCILPQSFLPARLRHINSQPFSDVSRSILNEYILTEKDQINLNFKNCRHELYNLRQCIATLPANEQPMLPYLMEYSHLVKQKECSKLKQHLVFKEERLFRSSPWVKFSLPDNVINISLMPLTSDQITILSYGLSFDLGPSNNCVLDFLSNFAKFEYFYNQTMTSAP